MFSLSIFFKKFRTNYNEKKQLRVGVHATRPTLLG